MARDREPYNAKFCKEVDCPERHGNKCGVAKCTYNRKWVIYWELYGVYPPGEVENA